MSDLLELYEEELVEKSDIEYDPFGYVEADEPQVDAQSIVDFDWDE